MSENELRKHIDGCRNQDRLSQKWIFEKYYRLMFGVCLRYTSDKDRVQDIVQEGFLKVFTNIEGYTSKGSFEGWIRRIMVNTAIDAIRKMKISPIELVDDFTIETHAEVDLLDVEDEEETNFSVHDILDAMNQLSPVYRAVFNMFVFDNLSHQEISNTLGISVGASKSNLAKAKRNVSSILLGQRQEKVAK